MEIMEEPAHQDEDRSHSLGTETSPNSGIARQCYNHRGLIYAFGSTCAFAVPSICVKVLQDEVGPNQLAFFRAVIISIMSFISLLHSGTPLKPSCWLELKFFVIHATFSTLAVATSFYAFQNMRAADAAAIVYAYPAFTALLGRFFLNFEVALLLITLSGVVLVSRPSVLFGHNAQQTKDSGSPLTPLVAFAGCICVSLVVISVRAMCKQDVNAVKVLFYYGLLGKLLPGILATGLGQWTLSSCFIPRLLTVVVGVVSFLANFLFVQALAIEDAVYVALICTNEALAVFILEVIFLGVTPEVMSVIGMMVILGSSFVLTLKRRKQIA